MPTAIAPPPYPLEVTRALATLQYDGMATAGAIAGTFKDLPALGLGACLVAAGAFPGTTRQQLTALLRSVSRYSAAEVSSAVQAIFPGPVLARVDWKVANDRLLLHDTDTNLYWLAWTEGRDLSRDQMPAQLVAGGRYAGFQYATMAQLEGLMATAGVPDPHGRTAANIPSVRTLISLLGANNFFGDLLGAGNSTVAHIGSPGNSAVFTIETRDNPMTAKAGELGGVVTNVVVPMGHALVTTNAPTVGGGA